MNENRWIGPRRRGPRAPLHNFSIMAVSIRRSGADGKEFFHLNAFFPDTPAIAAEIGQIPGEKILPPVSPKFTLQRNRNRLENAFKSNV